MRTILIFSVLALLCGFVSGQSTTRPRYFDRAQVKHSGPSVTVIANDSIPLLQAIQALRLEYGWQINWESAPGYSRFDVVDDTDPKWRKDHPSDKGVTRPAGGLFAATLPEPSDSDSNAERVVLGKLIEEYNATDNPGKYVLRFDTEGEFAVVGSSVRDDSATLQPIIPLLDTPISLPKAQRNVYGTVESILDALHSSTGKEVIFAVASSSLFINTQVTMGGARLPARELLRQALASTKRPLQYDLGFNPDVPVYILSISPAMREEDNGLGGRKLFPISSNP